jgi:hypothetical protein
MTVLSGFGSLAAIPEEKITDKITRRVLAGQKGMQLVDCDVQFRDVIFGHVAFLELSV